MKRIIAILTAALMLLALTGCIGMPASDNSATADEAVANLNTDKYDKDFAGLQKFLTDAKVVTADNKAEIFYDILGANDGVRYVLNGNAFVELYDFSGKQNDTAKTVLADIKDDGKFRAVEDGAELTGVITSSDKYVIAWDETRSYDYKKNIATDKVLKNW